MKKYQEVPRQKTPELSVDFLKFIRNQKPELRKVGGILVRTCKNVFPPESKFSESWKHFGILLKGMRNKRVLDIGTGTGIQALEAAKRGAFVIATDINPEAVKCAKFNVRLNKMERRVKILKSDLFSNVPAKRFDLIIANLPITNYPARDVVAQALYDPGLKLKKRLFESAPRYLKRGGSIVFAYADFQTRRDFEIIERLAKKYGFIVSGSHEYKALGFRWRYYRFALAKNARAR